MSKVALKGASTGTGTFTIESPATNTDRTLSLPDATGTILTTATPGVPVNGPAFSAVSTSNQTGISNNTFTKVLFGSENFDTGGCFNASAFTPTVAGYYQINVILDIGSTVTNGLVRIYKNGSSVVYGSGVIGGSTGELYIPASGLVYCNGSTDYIEAFVYVSSVSNVVYSGSTFSGFLARSAT